MNLQVIDCEKILHSVELFSFLEIHSSNKKWKKFQPSFIFFKKFRSLENPHHNSFHFLHNQSSIEIQISHNNCAAIISISINGCTDNEHDVEWMDYDASSEVMHDFFPMSHCYHLLALFGMSWKSIQQFYNVYWK